MKVAILHEMMVKIGGAEKVVEKLLKMYPEADLFTLIYDEEKVGDLFPKEKISKQVFSLKSQKIYNLFKKQRLCLPFMSQSVESLDLSDYDIVIASSSGFAHGAITKPETLFVVYSHSPARYMWDWTNEYKKDIGWDSGLKGFILNRFFLKLRQWDFQAAQRADILIANSSNVKNRIKKYYRRDAQIVYPNVQTSRFSQKINFKPQESEYYVIVSALTEFKKIDIAIAAFNLMKDKKLIIIGGGEHKQKLSQMIQTDNIKLIGPQYGEALIGYIQNSLGLIFPGEEDFGIVPIEAMAAGKPVFALNKGGLTETVIPGITGDFFHDPQGTDFIKEFEVFHTNNLTGLYSSESCKKQAHKYDEKNFEEQIKKIITKK